MIAVLPELILVLSALGVAAAAAAPLPREGSGQAASATSGKNDVRLLAPLAALTLCSALLALSPPPHAGPRLPDLPGCRPDALARYGKVLLALVFLVLQVAAVSRNRGWPAAGPGPGRAALLPLFLLALMVEVEATNLWLLIAAFVCAVVTLHRILEPERRAGRGLAVRRRRLWAGLAAGGLMALGAGWLLGLCGTSECADIAPCRTEPDLLILRLVAVLFLAAGPLLQLGIPPLLLLPPTTARSGKAAGLSGESAVGLALLPGVAALIALIRLPPLLPPEAAAAPLPAAPGLAALWCGALGALTGKRLRDVFVFLAIAQTGGALLALTPGGDATDAAGNTGLALYALSAEIPALCAAALALACRPRPARPGGPKRFQTPRDLQGLAFRDPLSTGVLTCGLAALAALPPFSGFMARFLTLTRMAQAGQGLLALLGALGSLLALAACLKALRPLYSPAPPNAPKDDAPPSLFVQALGLVMVLGLVLPGLLPARCLALLEALARTP